MSYSINPAPQKTRNRLKVLALGCLMGSLAVTASAATTELKIGYQKYGVLPLLKARGTLDKALSAQGVQVKWTEFTAGPQLLEGLNVGSVQLGETGETPPVFAQAAQAPIVYVGNQLPGPASEALIVPANSPYKSVSDLKGKRIVLNKGSNVHYLLLKLLEKNGLKLSDVQVVYLPPADARAAFEKGAVDAWAIWDPYLAAAEVQLHARSLANGQGVVANHEFFLAQRNYAAQNPKIIQTVINELTSTSQWATQHRTEASQLLQKQTGLPQVVVDQSVNRLAFGFNPITTTTIAEQQKVADAFYQQKLLPKPVKISDATLPELLKQ